MSHWVDATRTSSESLGNANRFLPPSPTFSATNPFVFSDIAPVAFTPEANDVSAPTWSQVTFGPVSERNTQNRFIAVPNFKDAGGGVDFRFSLLSNEADASAWFIEDETPISITSGTNEP